MATGGKLEIGIGADISDLQKKIKEAEFNLKDLSKTKIEQIKLGLDTKEINGNIKSVKQELNNLKTTLKDTGTAVAGMTPKVANGSNALMQFSRVAQDAPYGIMGIGNNITATVEAFGHLKNSTGSTGGALKAMASSIMGSGGILLGVSLLTTGLTLLSQSGLSVGDIIDKVTGKFDEFGNSIKKASEEAAKSASSEIATMNALVAVAQNKNLADENRFIAVDKLQKQYVVTFGNLSQETILNGNLEKVIRRTTDAIIAQSRAKAYTSRLDDLSVEQLKTYTEMQKVLGVLAKKYKVGAKDLLGFQEAMKKGTEATDDFLRKIHNDDRGQLSAYDLLGVSDIDTFTDLYKKAGEQNGKAYRLGLKIADETGAGIILDAIKPPKTKEKKTFNTPKTKEKKTFNTPQVSPLVSEILPEGLVLPAVNTAPITTSFKGIRETISSELLATQELLYNFSEDVNATVIGSLGSTFSNLGTAIGEALASGQNVFSAIGQSLLQSLAGFLSDMGDLLIKYGILAVAKGKIDLAILAGGPVSIGAGLAAIAVGVLLKAASGALGSKAKGGAGSQTSTSTGSGANNSTSSSGGFGWSGGGTNTVVFEIAGTSLIGVLNNTTARNLRIGGTN